MKSLRSHARAASPAADSPSSKPGSSRSSSFSKTRRIATNGASSPSKKPRPTPSTTNFGVGAASTSTSGTPLAKNKKRSKFYNKSCVEKPTELFRTDLISNMTVPDNEPLNNQEELILLADAWRKEWNEGVQVPVFENEDYLEEENDRIKILQGDKPASSPSPSSSRPPMPIFHEVEEDTLDDLAANFLAKSRFLRSKDRQEGATTSKIGGHVVQYELDDLDVRWLALANAKLRDMVAPRFTLNEDQLEKAIERLEVAYALRCSDESQSASFLRQQSDSDAVCDVCRDGVSEEGNLLVFCDRCEICVHQACYGIRRIPAGPWVCRPCSQDLKPSCILCPNRGGAMKPTRSGTRWAHVSCAIWIPEVEFGNPSLREPVTRIARVPEDRWMLQCEICNQRNGACIQCNVRNCHVSYHVTCAQRAGWKVTYKEAVPEDDPSDVLESYCKKHSKNWRPMASEDDESGEGPSGKQSDYKRQPAALAMYKLLIILSYSDLEHVFDRMNEIPIAFRRAIFYYWRTKRLSAPERSLIFDIDECQLAVERDREAEFICRRVDSLISLRQTLERTRTLCYMVERRERWKRQWIDTATKEFNLLSALDDMTSNRDGFRMDKFLQTFSLGYRLDNWRPKEEKIAQLLSLLPQPPVSKSAPVITPRKRGRPPTKSVVIKSGSSSPLATVNSPAPKKFSQQKKKYRGYEGDTPAMTRKGRGKGDGDESFAQTPKRKRVPRVQYSPN